MTKLHHNAKNLVGQRFKRLTVLEPTDKRKNGYIIWRCICSCGKKTFVSTRHLRNGDTKSCGCLQKEIVAKRMTTHGMWGTPIYQVWNDMIQRCENPKDTGYKNYGGRGISVCARWHSFPAFYADVGNPPVGMTLDRIDNDGDYEPDNWQWATRSQQNKNRRPISCWFFAYNENTGDWDENNSQVEFAKKHNLNRGNVSSCLHGNRKQTKGWTFQWIPGEQEGTIYD